MADAVPPSRAHEVIGRHLEAVPGRGRRSAPRPPLAASPRVDDRRRPAGPAARTTLPVAPVCVQAPAHELVDVAVIVGQQDPGLDVAPVGAGVVHQAAQRVIDAHGVEQRERALGVGRLSNSAVGDLVADHREQRRREIAGEVGGGGAAAPEVVAGLEHVGIGDLLGADADLDLGAVIRRPAAAAAQQIGAEIGGLGHRGGIDAGRGNLAKARGIDRRRAVRAVG